LNGTLIAIGIASLVLASVPESYGSGRIDLDVPGSLEAIELSHPEHLAKIQRILTEVPLLTPTEAETWMRTEFQARDIRYTDLIMTSLPPKKRLEFSLDDTSYVKVFTLTIAKPTPPSAMGVPRRRPNYPPR
jgi:hypothetical protein